LKKENLINNNIINWGLEKQPKLSEINNKTDR